jgi:curved DNA-binding protein CbpA
LADRRDYYAVLGVAPGSEDVVITAAYRALMRRYHPDTNKDATAQQKAREINEAYAVLGAAAKRAEYDRQRAARQTGGAQQQRNSGQGSSKAAAPKPSASSEASRRQQPPPPTVPSSKDGSAGWLIAASIIGILALPALLSGSGNEYAENTMNVDEILTTENVVATDTTAIDASLDAAGNAVKNATDALNSMESEAPPGLSKLPDAQVEYSNVESAAQKFAAILIKDGIAGARSFSDRCHKGVVAKPSWAAADYCAAFDFAAAHIDEAFSKEGKFPANGYFQFQSENQDDAYVAAGAYAFSLPPRLTTIRRAVEPAAVEALDDQLARRRAREQSKASSQSVPPVDETSADQARAD